MLELKIGTIVICAVCKLVGELWWHNAQRYMLPVTLGVAVSVVTHMWWLGLCVLPMIFPLVLGYTTYGPSNGFDRGAWLFAICFAAGIAYACLNHLPWLFYVPYTIIGGIWGATTRNLWNVLIAPVSGAIIGSMILFVH